LLLFQNDEITACVLRDLLVFTNFSLINISYIVLYNLVDKYIDYIIGDLTLSVKQTHSQSVRLSEVNGERGDPLP